jgi:hypothetical protein
MTLQLHRPDGEGGLEPHADAPADWRDQLASPKWNPAPLANPEMNPTRTRAAILFWLALGALTFVVLLAGYGTGFWK